MVASLPASGFLSNNSRTEGEMKQGFEDQRDAIGAKHNTDGTHQGDDMEVHGQCRLDFVSTTQIKLSVYKGNKILVKHPTSGWQIREIPSAGITIANTGVSQIGTPQNIYLYDSGGTLALEGSTAAHTFDGDTGVRIKSGDATRTLVGKVKLDASLLFRNTAEDRFVISYFHRRAIHLSQLLAVDKTTSSTSFVILDAALDLFFLTWGEDAVEAFAAGRARNDTVNGTNHHVVGLDGTAQLPVVQDTYPTAGIDRGFSVPYIGVPGEE
ncbi:MAG: hypothetical protein ACE5IM_11355, partial [Nitrospinota bacterium]